MKWYPKASITTWHRSKAKIALEIIKKGEIDRVTLAVKMGVSINSLDPILSVIRDDIDTVVAKGSDPAYCVKTPRAKL